MKKLLFFFLIGLVAAIIILVALHSTKGPQKGVSLSPIDYTEEHVAEFFETAVSGNDIITWAGAWQELQNEEGAPHVLMQLARRYGYAPVVITGMRDSEIGSAGDEAAYKEAVAAFAERYKPNHLGIGNEINFQKSPPLFSEIVRINNELLNKIKTVSPRTQVFTTFQYEWLKGLRSGLFRGVSAAAKTQWELLDAVSEFDLIGFTTYPGFIYKDPAEIPANYYAEIAAYTQKPIAFTEIGWFREGPPGWESDAEEQARFIERLGELTPKLPLEFMAWLFLYDQPHEIFTTMGLRGARGELTAPWEAWLAL